MLKLKLLNINNHSSILDSMSDNLLNAYNKITEVISEWGDSGIRLIPNIITSILILIAFFLISKFVRKKLGRILSKKMPNSPIIDLSLSLFHIFIMAFAVLTCLGILHLDKTVTTILAGIGVLGLAISFAFQHTSHDILSGIILAIKSPIKVGDIIETNNEYGEVIRVGLRATYIDNALGQTVVIPNRLILDNNLKAYSINSKRRVTIEGSIAYSSHLKESEKIIIECLKQIDNIEINKEIEFFYTEFGDNGVHYMVRFWIPFSNNHSDYLKAKSKAYRYIKIACDENNIDIPYPHRVIHVNYKNPLEKDK